MNVFAVFQTYDESDGYTVFDLMTVAADNVAAVSFIAAEVARDYSKHQNVRAVHKEMAKENNWTYWGSREDCDDTCNGFSGYVVEEMEVLE